jgi:hypothetical protein
LNVNYYSGITRNNLERSDERVKGTGGEKHPFSGIRRNNQERSDERVKGTGGEKHPRERNRETRILFEHAIRLEYDGKGE